MHPPYARPVNEPEACDLHSHCSESASTALSLCPTEDCLLQTAATITTRIHDFGKLSPVYQKEFHNPSTSPEYTDAQKELTREHSQSSAFTALHIARTLNLPDNHCVAIFCAIAKHHGTLSDIESYLNRYARAQKGDTKPRQSVENTIDHLKHIASTYPDESDWFFKETCGNRTGMDELFSEFSTHLTYLGNFTPTESFHRLLLQLYSLLTYGDKLSAGGLNYPEQDPLSVSAIDTHIKKITPDNLDKITASLNEKRETARQKVLNSLDDFAAHETKLARLTLPTGFGKTLTGLSAGLSLVNNHGHSRLVYALPFTSIIDQTDTEVQQIYSERDLSPDDPEYTIHQSLRETVTRVPDESYSDADEARLGELWQSQLTLTTFVQLLESIAAPTNRQSVKLPSLYNSVIVLDEPQAIPENWWHLASKLINILTTDYNATVIFMTATQPQILSELPHTNNPYDLLPDTTPYTDFIAANPRINLSIHQSVQTLINTNSPTPLSHAEAAAEITADSQSHDTLTICNTITSATTLHQHITTDNTLEINKVLNAYWQDPPTDQSPQSYLIQTILTSNADTITACLTTRLRPRDRNILLAVIETLLETAHQTHPQQIYVTSTQLIEAGVDVSFDRLYRDFAPFPSLVQSAGRCNRHFTGETRTVTVLYLDSPTGTTPPAKTIYTRGYDRLTPTQQTLQTLTQNTPTETTIPEAPFIRDGPDEYYTQLHDTDKNGDKSYLTYIKNAQYTQLRKKSLIEDDFQSVDVVILCTTSDKDLYRKYANNAATHNWNTASDANQTLKHLTISVPQQSDSLKQTDAYPDPHQDGRYILDTTRTQQYTIHGNHGLNTQSVSDRLL